MVFCSAADSELQYSPTGRMSQPPVEPHEVLRQEGSRSESPVESRNTTDGHQKAPVQVHCSPQDCRLESRGILRSPWDDRQQLPIQEDFSPPGSRPESVAESSCPSNGRQQAPVREIDRSPLDPTSRLRGGLQSRLCDRQQTSIRAVYDSQCELTPRSSGSSCKNSCTSIVLKVDTWLLNFGNTCFNLCCCRIVLIVFNCIIKS